MPLYDKKILSEQFVLQGYVDKEVSKIDLDLVKSHLLGSLSSSKRLSTYSFSPDYNCFKFNYHQHIQWIQDYIRDHFNQRYGETVAPVDQNDNSVLILQPGDSVNIQNHINDYDLINSPDYTCLYCVDTGKIKSETILYYDDNKLKNNILPIPIQKGNFILFNSSVNFSITKNESTDFIMIMIFKYKTIRPNQAGSRILPKIPK